MPKSNRQKISTTIAPENSAYLRTLVKRGKAANLAEAVDRVVAQARQADSRARLEAATEAYFATLSPEQIEDENALGAALSYEAGKVNFDE